MVRPRAISLINSGSEGSKSPIKRSDVEHADSATDTIVRKGTPVFQTSSKSNAHAHERSRAALSSRGSRSPMKRAAKLDRGYDANAASEIVRNGTPRSTKKTIQTSRDRLIVDDHSPSPASPEAVEEVEPRRRSLDVLKTAQKARANGQRSSHVSRNHEGADDIEEDQEEEEVEDVESLDQMEHVRREEDQPVAGSSRMARTSTNRSDRTNKSSSDPLAIGGVDGEVDELESSEAEAPIEISYGSESDYRPRPRVKRPKRMPLASGSDFEIEPRSHAPDGGRYHSRDRGGSSRRRVVVEIPLLPLRQLRRYYHPKEVQAQRPDHFTRQDLPLTSNSLYSSIHHTMRAKGKGKAPALDPSLDPDGSFARDVLSAPSSNDGAQWDQSDASEDEEDEDGDMYSDDDSDPIALRRSRRNERKMPEKVKPRTRGMRALEKSRAPVSRLTTSSVSEASFYGHSAPKSRLPPNLRESRRDIDSEQSSVMSGTQRRSTWRVESEGEEEMEVDDSGGSIYQEESDQLEDTDEELSQASEDGALGRHRAFCEKCSRTPANEILARAIARKKRPGKRRKKHEDEMSDEELVNELQGWLECSKCVIASHWGCLATSQQKDVLHDLAAQEGPPAPGERRRRSVLIDERADFTCARCTANSACFVCHEDDLKNAKISTLDVQEGSVSPTDNTRSGEASKTIGKGKAASEGMDIDHHIEVDADTKSQIAQDQPQQGSALKFRCYRCKQACHYEHLKEPSDRDYKPDRRNPLESKADWYQYTPQNWLCHQCRDWVWPIDIICAWRPLPANAVEKSNADATPSYKDPLPREYLVKWTGRGFRHATWVPHAWALATSAQKLRNFLEKGPSLDLVTDETLAARGDDMAQPTIARVMDEDDRVRGQDAKNGRSSAHTAHHKDEWKGYGPPPDVDTESSIPQEWRTVDRVLDVMLLPPVAATRKGPTKKKSGRGNRILSDSSAESDKETLQNGHMGGGQADKGKQSVKVQERPDGLDPPKEDKVDIDEWERKTGRKLTGEDVDEVATMVTWCFVKWDDLQYDQSCWDTPPPVDSSLYPAFKRALERYLKARLVNVPVLSKPQAGLRDAMAKRMKEPPAAQPDCIVGGQLMPFQLEGFQWLLMKHFRRESCILADDMGLGKTIQIASLLGYLGSSGLDIYPCLVVVPNSTITNWVREFEKWVPHMRVVPYYGESASRKVIHKYELYHMSLQGKAQGLKAHVVLTTYDIITGSDFRIFNNIPRWEVLCVDEGQRLKSDGSLIFNRLKTLHTVHRILLTGTPLNNNLRELFNLLNFLDRDTFRDLEDLEARFEDLNEAKVTELHEMIKPYILRRIKADVLKLPPMIEIIVPISLAPLQKNVYKTILERNADVLQAIAEQRRKRSDREAKAAKANGSKH